jgi:mannose-6-phosphate isomerase
MDNNPKAGNSQAEDHRPWGYFVVLEDAPDHKVKRIVVSPGKRLSLQRHQRRAEHWYVVEGEALVTLDRKDIPLKAGQAVDIPRAGWHRMANPGTRDMAFIEVQTGDYFGEDDIERSQDDYGRS